ncbi:MAG TPA: ABC-2 family transporter protein [Anaerolineales bacterium]|jgi:ABC-2 type transport system permease protein|nr:ABC-2 family transporter protein [Anaerolineales bacterium]HQX15193.1 ABC-2 family transporter protein [Anaerolineales bacterium]
MNTIKLAWTYMRIGMLNELQYRANFFIQLFQSAVAVGTGLIGLSLVFGQVDNLAGWSRGELLAVMGVHILMGGVIRSAIQPNMERLMNDVLNGTLDFALTKPADAQTLVSVREFRFWQLTDVVVGVAILIVAVTQLQAKMEALQIVAFVAALLMGAVLLYCVWLMVTSIAFWVIRVGDIVDLFQGLYAAGRWPVSVYPDWLRTGLTFLVPVAFAVTVPAEAMTNRLTGETMLFALGLTLLFVILARVVWLIGLRSYSGASA